MRLLNEIHFPTQSSFHLWLETNYGKSPGIWLIFYKKHTGMECIQYREALEEALCFGWIDSLIKKIDDDRYARKFTPRTNAAKWSEINKKMVDALIKEGRMTEAGLNKIESYPKTGKVIWDIEESAPKRTKELETPEFILKTYAENEPALSHFLHLPQSCKKEYILWITSAKREETIFRRLNESVELLRENRKLGLK
jgi:uncharacterized protein YdeI (YjbR/CyaY-like superfamily)